MKFYETNAVDNIETRKKKTKKILNRNLIGTELKRETAYYFIIASCSQSFPPPFHFNSY